MKEDLLTSDEIKAILDEASSGYWADPRLVIPGSKKASIFRISHSSNLIMFNGNDTTGVQHILHRHRFGRQVWEENKEELNQASEIRQGVAPYDYLQIAESVYKPENRRDDLNRRSDEFDMYVGHHIHLNGDAIEYRLLTYKNTGIVHTLYPKKSDNQRKKLLKYRQGATHWIWDTGRSRHIYTTPYYNKSGQVVFKIIVLGRDRYPLERIYIEIVEGGNVNAQVLFIKEFAFDIPIEHGVFRSLVIEHSNKSDFEQTAVKILNGTFKPDPKEKLHLLDWRDPNTVLSYFAW